MTNLIVNGTFDTGISPWAVSGVRAPATIVDGALNMQNDFSSSACAAQTFTTTVAGEYTLTGRLWGSLPKSWQITIAPELSTSRFVDQQAWSLFTVVVTLPAGVTRTLRLCHGDSYQTHGRIDDVALMDPLGAFLVTLDTATLASQPNVVHIGNATPGQVMTIVRESDSGPEVIAKRVTANASGQATFTDYRYPLGSAVTYTVHDTTLTTMLGSVGPVTTSDSEFPWLHDVFLPELLNTPTTIVDITGRVRNSRVTVYRVVSQRLPVTLGDIRQSSDGTMTLFCRDHAERDRVIATLSSGYPCSLRVPADCRPVIDDMVFTPLDITETRFGTSGACTLDVDFAEASAEDLSQFVATNYATQTTNAGAVSLTYAGLSANFLGKTYAALYVSPDGVQP